MKLFSVKTTNLRALIKGCETETEALQLVKESARSWKTQSWAIRVAREAELKEFVEKLESNEIQIKPIYPRTGDSYVENQLVDYDLTNDYESGLVSLSGETEKWVDWQILYWLPNYPTESIVLTPFFASDYSDAYRRAVILYRDSYTKYTSENDFKLEEFINLPVCPVPLPLKP